MALVPFLSILAAIFWGFTLFLAGTRQSSRTVILFFLLDVGSFFVLFGMYPPAMFYMLAVGLPSTVIGMMASEKRDYYLMRKTSLLMGAGGTALFLSFLYRTLGMDWETLKAQTIESAIPVLERVFNSSAVQPLNSGAVSEHLNQLIPQIAETAFHLIPASYFLQMLLAIYFVLSLANLYIVKKNEPWLKKKPLASEQMPWQMAWVFIMGLGFAFWDYGTGSLLFYAGLNLMLFMAPVGFYFGCAVVSGKYQAYTAEKRRNAFIIFAIICILVPEIILMFIILLGIFDSILDYRKINPSKKA